jgi:HlyD family secretion protein
MARMNLRAALTALGVMCISACGSGDPARFVGYVEGEYVRVAAPASGQLQGLFVERGATVEAGAPLFELEQVREQAAVAEAEARVADLRKGKRADEVDVIRAQAEQARAQLQLATAQLKRFEELRPKGLVSAEQLDAARSESDRAKARVRELEAQLRTADLSARSDAIRGAEAQLEQVRWQLAQKKGVAPAAGLVDDTLYRVGEWVPAGAPVVSLLPPQNRVVRFYVPEPVVATLRPGQAVQVHRDGADAPLAATISFIAPRAEFTPPVIYSREARAKLVFLIEARPAAADAATLHPGQPVDVELGP